MTVLAEDDGALELWRDVVERSNLAVILIQLSTHHVVARSPTAENLLGEVSSPDDLMGDPAAAHRRLGLLAAGVINGYRVRSAFAAPSGASGEALFDVNRPETPGAGDLAIAVITPDDDLGSGSSSDELERMVKSDPEIEIKGPILLGTVDSSWRIAQISHDLVECLDYMPDEVIGSPLSTLINPRDVGNLLIGVGQSFEQAESIRVRIEIKHANGEFSPFSVAIVPFEAPEFAFVAWPIGASEEESVDKSAEARVTELEKRLWRIALEIQATGVVHQLHRLPDLHKVPGITELSARQLEVLTRLLDGQRVPDIAREMFVSPSTVRNHLGAIYRRLGVHSQAQLLARVRELGEMTG